MNRDEINFLLQAGYTVSEIMNMSAGNPDPEPAPAPAPEPEPAPAPAPEPAPAPTPAPAPEPALPVDPGYSDMTRKLDELISVIRAGNLHNGNFHVPDPQNSVDQVLANIVNPPAKRPATKK